MIYTEDHRKGLLLGESPTGKSLMGIVREIIKYIDLGIVNADSLRIQRHILSHRRAYTKYQAKENGVEFFEAILLWDDDVWNNILTELSNHDYYKAQHIAWCVRGANND